MRPVIGREEEQKILTTVYNSGNPEFIALWGRRRVGKTYLIANTFTSTDKTILFYTTGTKNGTMAQQIKNFTEAIGDTFWYKGAPIEPQKDWRDTFKVLTDTIKKTAAHKKIVLFFDEFPWMVTRKSQLLETLEYFWNHYWAHDPRIKLIICGSSSGWILKHIVNNRGGLYNRVTCRMRLEPFNLYQTKRYLEHKHIQLDHKDITHLYMVVGGIPFYLNQITAGLSAAQNIEKLAFQKNSFLVEEFPNLYATLFGTQGAHIEIARTIAQHCYGIGQAELATKIGPALGGSLVQWLKDLEQAGFISRFTPFGHTKRGIYYKMVDEYSLFYFHWIEPIQSTLLERGMKEGYWQSIQRSPTWHSWAGCAFESICNKHIPQISTSLMLSPLAIPYSWRYTPVKGSKEEGAQIDLLFDREDRAISICEIKYTEKPFALTKQYAKALQKKIDVFKKQTRTRKNIFLALITASGFKETIHSKGLVTSIVTLDDLFKSQT